MLPAEEVAHGWVAEDVRGAGSWLTEQSSVRAPVCARGRVSVCVSQAAPNEISRQAQVLSQRRAKATQGQSRRFC